MSNCSILVMSCDKNQKLLSLFLKFFATNWQDCVFPIYVSTETLSFQNSQVISLNSSALHWGQRLLEALNSISSEFVVLILDDYLIEEKVDEDAVNNYLNLLKQNSEIGCITLVNIPDKKNEESSFRNLLKRNRRGAYLLNTQISIWRKNLLKQLIRPKDNPWQAELYGSIRARRFYQFHFYCLVSDNVMPIRYNRGWLVVRGVWNADEIERLKLQPYLESIYDGKDIVHLGYQKIKSSLYIKIIQKAGICIRKFFSIFGVYF